MGRGPTAFYWIAGALLLVAVYRLLLSSGRLAGPDLGEESEQSDALGCDISRAAAESSLAHGADKKVSVLIDFAGAARKDDVRRTFDAVVRSSVDRRYVADVVLVDNQCQDDETRRYVRDLPSFEDVECKVVHVDARGTPVSAGRARTEALKHASGDVVVFLSAGVVPRRGWLAPLLAEIARSGETIAVPLIRADGNAAAKRDVIAWTLTWSLGVAPAPLRNASASEPTEVPALTGLAFAVRRDLLDELGGYDSYFHKPDVADIVGLALSAWLCGARIVLVPCSLMVYDGDLSSTTVADHSYAKYLIEVYMKKQASSIDHPGVDAFQFNADVHMAAEARVHLLSTLGCVPFDWYVQRFKEHMPTASQALAPYFPEDVPKKSVPTWDGRFFAVFGGRCLHPGSSGLLTMQWCPSPLPDDHRFHWAKQGHIEVVGKCLVSKKDADWYYAVDGCNATHASQQFDYLPETRQIRHKLSGLCATHVTNANDGSQGLMGTSCLPASHKDYKYQLFVRNGAWH